MNAFFAKKSLGQNFLTSKEALADIVTAGKVAENDIVVEIGPGEGVLTEALLAQKARVLAIEKDDRLIGQLTEKFKAYIEQEKLVVLHQDALTFNPKEYGLKQGSYKLIANIPYYITGEIIRQFTEKVAQPSLMVLMVQKEVAARIVARDAKESILSISVKVFGDPSYIRTVPAAFFKPQPKVDSAILLVDNLNESYFTANQLEKTRFFDILHAGFAHKRKLLARNLEDAASNEKIKEAFAALSLDPNTRAEDLDVLTWKNLAVKLK